MAYFEYPNCYYFAKTIAMLTNAAGPFLLVEDDEDDEKLFVEILQSFNIPNSIMCFRNGKDLLTYLRASEEVPFMILCDINMPVMDGFMLRNKMNEDRALRGRSTPFIFFSTHAGTATVQKAYQLCIQGFFQKGNSVTELTQALRTIVDYWSVSQRPQ